MYVKIIYVWWCRNKGIKEKVCGEIEDFIVKVKVYQGLALSLSFVFIGYG